MAATPTGIVTLAQAKAQLEIPASVTDEDAQVSDLIAEAVDWIANKTGLPLIGRTERYRVPLRRNEPLLAAIFNVTAVTGHEFEHAASGVRISVPAGGWPETEDVVLSVTRDVDPVPASVRRLALELISRLYEGVPAGRGGGVRVMLEAVPREPTRRLQPI